MAIALPVSVGDRTIALGNEILRTVCGSGVHGMAIQGHDDHDEMGVYIEAPEQLIGLMPSSEHYVSRTKPEGVRSEAGDTDLTIYSLRKYARLAVAGNPTVLTVLYAPQDAVLVATPAGERLREMAPHIVSMNAGRRHLGYLDGQRERLIGGGKQGRVPNRPELIEAHGYDTKYASHALRLGLQGIELVSTGTLSLPLRPDDLEQCMEVKRGLVGFDEALARVDRTRAKLASLIDERNTPLRDAPDMRKVNAWLIEEHREHWSNL
jgi:hypothetical protein